MQRRTDSFDVKEIQLAFQAFSEGEVMADAIGSPQACSTIIHLAARLALRHTGNNFQWEHDAEKLTSYLRYLSEPANMANAEYYNTVESAIRILEGWEEKIESGDTYMRGYLAASIALIEGVAAYWRAEAAQT